MLWELKRNEHLLSTTHGEGLGKGLHKHSNSGAEDGLGVRELCLLLAVWRWVYYLIPLCLSFLQWKIHSNYSTINACFHEFLTGNMSWELLF